MPDFDKNLQPIIKEDPRPSIDVKIKAPTPVAPMTFTNGSGGGFDNLSSSQNVFDRLNAATKNSDFTEKGIFITNKELSENKRYTAFNPTIPNYEDFAAYGQSNWDKAANGVLKGLNLAATTIAGGFGMLYGIPKSMFSGRLADVWDNEVMRKLDEWNTKVDNEYLPNYYTQAEKDAAWYSPTNLFTTNFLFDKLIKNSGYAVGAMLSGNIANAGLVRAGAALGRAASAGASAAEASQAFKLFSPLLRNTSRAFSAAKNIEAAAILENRISSIADLTARSSELAKIAKTTTDFARFSDAARRTAIAVYSSAGEASFEALQTAKEFRENLIAEYIKETGQEPTEQALADIDAKADQVGKTSFFANVGILGLTEFKQLPYLLGSSYRNTRQAANAIGGKVDDVLFKEGKYVANTATTKFGRLYDKFTGVGRYIFDPKEATQEVAQYALQVGTQNYFNKANRTNDADVWVDGFLYGLVGEDENKEGVGALVSKEGMESLVLGGITGGLLQAKGKIQETKEVTNNTNRFINQLNSAPTFKEAVKDKLSYANRAVVLQEQQENAVIQGNELEARDLHMDLMHNYLAPRIKYGRFDMVMSDLNDLRNAATTEEGLAELKAQGVANVNDTVPTYRKRLENIERVAKTTNDFYESLNLRYAGVRQEDGSRKYSPYVIDKMVYAASKIADYDVRIPQLNNILSEYGVLTGDVLKTIMKENKPNREATKQALDTINDLDTTSEVKDGLKTALQDVIELSMRRKMFMGEYDDIKANPLNYETDPDVKFGDTVEVPVSVEDAGIEEATRKLEIGKEYSLAQPLRKEGSELILAPKLTVLSQTLGGELEVKLPNGKTTFLGPEEFDQFVISEEDNTSKEMEDTLNSAIKTVLKEDKYKGIEKPEENLVQFVNSLDNQELINDIEAEFDRQTKEITERREEEKRQQQELIKNRAALEKQQAEIENKSATIATPPPPTAEELEAMAASQGKLKAASKLFISGITPTERADEPVHIRNSREFLNNAKNFANRNSLATILVTPNQETALGLNGLTQLSYGSEDSSDSKNIETGFVAQVFVEQDGGKTFFVDKNGERIAEVNGQPVDIQRVIFQTMPTTSLYDRSGKPRFRADQLAEAEAASKAWGAKRAELFENPAFPIKAYRFAISRGVAIMNIVDGKYERNQVGDILIPEDRIATQEGLLQVVTDGSVVHNGENIKFNNGLTVLQYGDTLQIVNNNKLGASKAKAVYMAIKTMMDKFQQTKKLDVNLANYIQNVLYWRKTGTTTGNQIFINTATGEVSLGGKNYTPADLVNKESEIVDQLKEAFHTINNTTLRDRFYEPFYEYKVEDDKLVEVEWDNYQSYLLSKKGRSADQTPLVTTVAKPTEAVPYSFKQKYATLIDFELPVIQAPKAAPVAEGKDVIGEFVMDGETVNTFNGFTAGPVQFKGKITDGKIDIAFNDVVENDTVVNVAKNGKLINDSIVPALKAANVFDPSADDIELVKTFIAGRLVKELQDIQKAAPAAAPVSDVEAKKADIERRRNEELDENLKMRETLAKDPDISDEDYQKIVARQQANASKIDAKYDAELAALEGAKPTTETYNPGETGAPQDEYMRVGVEEAGVERLTDAQIELFKNWAAEKVPGIPFEVLDNLVDTYDNEKAWGVFENGVAKFYKGAPGTTPYHEAFEGIWKGFLTPEQRQLILDEFRAKTGQFTDRASGKKINYAEATDRQAKERIADDFGAFRMGKLPARTLGERITKFFRSIIEFFKSFVQKPSLKEGLFKAIDEGKFKDLILPASVAAATPEYMRIPGLTETQAYEFTEDMTIRAAQFIFGDSKKSLYDIKKITSKEIFDRIKEAYASPTERKYQQLGEERFNQLVVRTKEKLRTLGINFNEEDTIDINDENITSRDYAPEPFSTDWKKTSPFAIKFLLATLPQVEPTNQKNASSLSLPKRVLSSIIGYKLTSFGRVFNTLIDKLSNTTDVNILDKKLSDLAKADATYVRFFQRVGGDLSTGTIPFDNFKTKEDWRLFINFFQTFTKQKPNAVIQYIDGSSVYTAPANQFTTSKLLQSEWFENMKALADDPKSIIRKNKLDKTYQVDRSKLPTAVPKEPKPMVDFLTNMGVGFPLSVYTSLKEPQQRKFAEAVAGIYTYIQKTPDIGSLTGKTLGINPQLSDLSNLYIAATNPSQDSTYFGVENQRLQSYADNNVPSVMENEFNSVDTAEKLKELRPELNDVFSTNSAVLKNGGLFFNKEGKRIKSLKIGTIQGTKVIDTDKGTTTNRLTLGSRFTQEINENINGNYYILVPADGSTEWTINLGNNISFEDIVGGRATTKIQNIFKGYLQDEVALALDAENRKKIKNVGDKASELRFFKEMLSDKDLKNINNLIAEGATQGEINKYIDDNIETITTSVIDFINKTATETKELLLNNNQISQVGENQYSYPFLQDAFATKNNVNKFKMSEDDVNNLLAFVNTNYIINNIELHKLIFGDPYEFKIKDGKLDETKRIKSFLSPRRTTFDSPAYNSFLNKEYNKAGEIELSPNDPGYHLHKSFTNTITLSDVELSSNLYPKINEADAASVIMDNTYREVKLKNGQWTTEAENWHQWQMAYTRNRLAALGEYTYTDAKLQAADSKLISKPEPVFVTEVLKPIVSGVKAGETMIDNVLDKFSQMPLYLKAVEGTNLEKLYIKMLKEKIGYAVFESGRKVGATNLNNLYNKDGGINEKVFTGLVKVPWKAYGIQVENAFENPKDQTRGSQLTKLSSLDLFSDGKGSPEAKKAYERNLKALNALHKNGYNALLNRLGLEDLGEGSGFRLVNPAAVQENLEYEMLRREMAENAKDTIKLDENGQFPIPFEASPAYRQIKDILFSMVNKALVSPKMNGMSAVQVPVTGWEKGNRTPGSPNPALKFYTKKDPYMEVLLPHWFRGKFSKKKFPNDEAILKYLNTTPEGKTILKGIGFRIPTQSMSSIEVFRVKGFLPQSMGATIVVPSEVTAKAGSDFDIDKMNTYLRSTYIDKNGDIKLVKFQGSEEATKEFFAGVFDETLEKKKINKAELLEATQILAYGLEDTKGLLDKYSNLLDVLLADETNSDAFEERIMEELEKLGDVNLQAKLKNRFVEDMYRRSLENEYYDALEEMITLPENFDRLVSPVDDAGLSKAATELDTLRGEDETTIPNRLLNRTFMTTLRNAFVTAKKWVGIAAVNITGQSLTQKSEVYIDPVKIEGLSEFEKKILGDGRVQLPHNTVEVDGNEYISISGKMTKDGTQYISDRLSGYATSFVDVAKDPYIMKIIGSDSVVGVFMFLERIGAGENTIWFLNQPIIREYLSYLDSIGKRGLFGKADQEYIRGKFPTSKKTAEFDVNVDVLKDNIKEYYTTYVDDAGKIQYKGLNNDRNAEQQAIFNEFLKYAKMAEYSFKLTQATNYDTTKFRNSDEFSRKQSRTTLARQKNIFSSVDKILDSSFIGDQAKYIDGAMSSLGEIIKTEKDDFTIITGDVIKPYEENEFMSAEDFNRIAGKAKASFLDFVIQTQSTLNTEIEALVVGNTSVADQLAQAKKRHPEMKILNELQVVSSDRIEGGAKSIRLRANLKDAFDTDMYTDMMRELKVVEPELYNGLLKIALLQGTYQTSISIRNIMPIEDFAPLVKKVIDPLSSTEDIKSFSTSGVFQKNNWKDNTVVPSVQPKFFLASYIDPISKQRIEFDPFEDAETGELIYRHNSPSFPALEITKDIIIDETDRKVLLLSEIYNSSDVKYDVVKIPRIVTDKKTGERVDMLTGLTVTPATFARRRAQGDLSQRDFFGYQKVKYANGEPLVTIKGEHVYKLVNLYGDGQLVSEYYLDSRPSVINNGTVKVDNEISDADLIKFFGPAVVAKETVVPSQAKTIKLKDNVDYPITDINADMLEKMGYTPTEIGKILKSIC
jgi:hypothetical protein